VYLDTDENHCGACGKRCLGRALRWRRVPVSIRRDHAAVCVDERQSEQLRRLRHPVPCHEALRGRAMRVRCRLTLCNGACLNLQTDRNNCGTCNHVCQGRKHA
jgi:hypothetical protein